MNKTPAAEARRDKDNTLSIACTEESLVTDSRACLTPCEMVERKLVKLLHNQPLPVSHQTTTRRILRGA
jgi:hypothetical protein